MSEARSRFSVSSSALNDKRIRSVNHDRGALRPGILAPAPFGLGAGMAYVIGQTSCEDCILICCACLSKASCRENGAREELVRANPFRNEANGWRKFQSRKPSCTPALRCWPGSAILVEVVTAFRHSFGRLRISFLFWHAWSIDSRHHEYWEDYWPSCEGHAKIAV